jgi:hypothetical protein
MKLVVQNKLNSVKIIILLAIFFTLPVLFTMEQEVYAQSQEAVTISAQPGLDGFCKADAWLPVHISVENTGEDINARVQTSYKNSASGQTVNGMDISLPATSRKEFFLYVRPEGLMRAFTVSVLDKNTTIAKSNINISCSSDPITLLGVVSDSPSTYTMLNNVIPLTGMTRTAQLNISDLPDNAQGWGMLDALIISNVDTGTLKSEQKKALELWLANGGKLFVTGGIQWQKSAAGLSDFLPIKLISTKSVAGLPALSAYAMDSTLLESESILATGQIETDANALVVQNGIPVLIEKKIGYGKVYFFAADPGLRPLNDWDGMSDIYEHLLATKSPKPSWADGPWDSYQASTALSTLPELALPSFVYICCWLGLYIVIIGPVNYFVLRRLKRTELAWVTVPVLVVIFTSLAYFSGYLYRGTSPILNRIMLSQAWQGVRQTQNTALVGLYSPSRTTYNVESQEQFLIFPYPDMNENLQGNNDWLSLKNENGVSLPDVRVEIGGMQSIGVEGSLPKNNTLGIQHDLILTITNNIPSLKGSITNSGNFTLKNAALVTSSGWEIIGDLAPNESRSIHTTLINNSNSASASQFTIQAAFGWDPYANDNIDDRRHAALFQSVTASPSNVVNVNSGVYLMGWIDNEIPAPIGLQDQNFNVIDTLLYFEKLAPALEINKGDLMLTSSIFSWESSLGDSLTTSYYNVPSSGYNVRFQPSLPVHFSSVDSLTLTIGTSTTPDKLQISLWDPHSKTWASIPLGLFYTVDIPDPWKYVGMDGEILMNINGDPNDYFEITAIDFTLMVQP